MNWRDTMARLVGELRTARQFQCCDGDVCTMVHAKELLQRIDEITEKYKGLLQGRKGRV